MALAPVAGSLRPRCRAARVSSRSSAAAALCTALLPFGAALAATTNVGTVPAVGLVLYRFKQFLIANAAWSVLGFSILSIVAGGYLLKLVTGESSAEAIFRSYALLNNAPGSDTVDSEATWKDRTVSNFLYLVGIITFAVLIGVVGDAIGSSVEEVRTYNGRVLEAQHTVLVNWGDYTRPMLRQLEAARKEGRLKGSVVLIADRDKEDMDADVADERGKMGGMGLTVVTREGCPTELENMDRVAVGTAKRLIVVPPLKGEEGADDADDAGNLRAKLKQSTSVAAALQQNVFKRQERRATAVVSVPSNYESEEGQQEGFSTYAEVSPGDFVSRVLAQCTIQPGLSDVYEEILLQGNGNELYATPLKKWGFLHGTTFGGAWRHFAKGTPLGVIRQGEGEAPELHLSPADDYELTADDSLVLLAGDERDAEPSRSKLALTLEAKAEAEADKAELQPEAMAEHRVLLLNWNERTPDFIEQARPPECGVG